MGVQSTGKIVLQQHGGEPQEEEEMADGRRWQYFVNLSQPCILVFFAVHVKDDALTHHQSIIIKLSFVLKIVISLLNKSDKIKNVRLSWNKPASTWQIIYWKRNSSNVVTKLRCSMRGSSKRKKPQSTNNLISVSFYFGRKVEKSLWSQKSRLLK